MQTTRERVGVVGSGVAGLTAAYLSQRAYDVILFEAGGSPGGYGPRRATRPRGFHEDGCAAGFRAARSLGVHW